MINKYMGATPHESTREDCGQEARRLLKEVRRIVYELEMKMMQPEHMKLEMFRRGSEDLKNFIVKRWANRPDLFFWGFFKYNNQGWKVKWGFHFLEVNSKTRDLNRKL